MSKMFRAGLSGCDLSCEISVLGICGYSVKMISDDLLGSYGCIVSDGLDA